MSWSRRWAPRSPIFGPVFYRILCVEDSSLDANSVRQISKSHKVAHMWWNMPLRSDHSYHLHKNDPFFVMFSANENLIACKLYAPLYLFSKGVEQLQKVISNHQVETITYIGKQTQTTTGMTSPHLCIVDMQKRIERSNSEHIIVCTDERTLKWCRIYSW